MFEIKVIVDLGEKTVALLTGGIALASAPKAKEPLAVEAATPKEVADAPKVDLAKKEPEKRTRRTKEQIAAEEAQTANGWDDMDNDTKLEALKAEVTKHTKRGKSADIKFLLAHFEAGRASELSPEDYAFFDAVTRYGKGESVETIFPENLD